MLSFFTIYFYVCSYSNREPILVRDAQVIELYIHFWTLSCEMVKRLIIVYYW